MTDMVCVANGYNRYCKHRGILYRSNYHALFWLDINLIAKLCFGHQLLRQISECSLTAIYNILWGPIATSHNQLQVEDAWK